MPHSQAGGGRLVAAARKGRPLGSSLPSPGSDVLEEALLVDDGQTPIEGGLVEKELLAGLRSALHGLRDRDRSAWPHPDWLLMFYFLPFWFFKGETRILGALIIPLALLLLLTLAPRLGRAGARRGIIVGLAIFGVAGVFWLFAQTAAMGSKVPLQGCTACHRSTIVGGAPTQLYEFKIRDPDWLVFHLRDPEGSLLVPFSTPPETKQ